LGSVTQNAVLFFCGWLYSSCPADMFNVNHSVWYQVLTAVAMANTVLWEVMLCSQLA
jgi:hypothetical protein